MKNFLNYIVILLSASLFFSCEDVIDVDLDDGVSQLAVDGWITEPTWAATHQINNDTKLF